MLNSLTLNFNLRSPRKTKSATPIYCVIAIDGKQSKLPMGLKVNSYQWSKQKQLCTIAANMTDSDRENNIAANAKLNAVRCMYDEYFVYLCSRSVEKVKATDIVNELREKINSILQINMANKNAIPPKRTTTATTLIKRAFEIRYPKDTTTASTLSTQEYRLKAYLDYLKESKKGDTPQNHLTQEGLNDYKEYLQGGEIKRSAKVINQYCQLIERLINVVLCVKSEFRKYKLSLVKYVNIEDKRKKNETKKIALTNDEIEAIKNVQGLTEKEQEYRDLFIMQLETGVRYSDLSKLFSGDYITTTKDKQTTYTINTQKEGITAAIVVTHTIKALQQKYKDGFAYNDFTLQNNGHYYNYNLKAIAKKANLTRVVEYVDAQGNKKADSLCEIISNHYARHTFITIKLREGYTPAEVAKMTGHADTRMIEKVYEHLNEEDKALQVIDAVKRNQRKQSNDNNDNDNDLIAEQAREIHAYKKADEQREINRLKSNFASAKNELLFFVRGEYGLSEIDNGDIVAPESGKVVLPNDSNKSLYEVLFGNAPTLEEYVEMENQGITLIDAYNSGKIKLILDID